MKKIPLLVLLAILTQQLRAQDLADLFENNKQSVVTIYVLESLNTGTGDPRTFTSSEGLGSGVLVRDDIVLTAAHVVANAEKIMVQFYDGEAVEATTTRIARIADVALITLKRPPANPQVAVIGNSDEVRIGDEVFLDQFKGKLEWFHTENGWKGYIRPEARSKLEQVGLIQPEHNTQSIEINLTAQKRRKIGRTEVLEILSEITSES